jgi:4-carboxymuconolactone decarboxylase
MSQTASDTDLDRIAQGDAPVLETVLAMNLDALERSGLDATTYTLVRLAALVALDAPPVSYAITIGAAAEAGVTLEQAQAVLVAIAPVVGSVRVTAAAGGILRAALGITALTDEDSPAPQQRTS